MPDSHSYWGLFKWRPKNERRFGVSTCCTRLEVWRINSPLLNLSLFEKSRTLDLFIYLFIVEKHCINERTSCHQFFHSVETILANCLGSTKSEYSYAVVLLPWHVNDVPTVVWMYRWSDSTDLCPGSLVKIMLVWCFAGVLFVSFKSGAFTCSNRWQPFPCKQQHVWEVPVAEMGTS